MILLIFIKEKKRLTQKLLHFILPHLKGILSNRTI